VAGEVDRHQRHAERERDRVPRVRVLRAAVQQDDLRRRAGVAPQERAQLPPVGQVDVPALDRRRARPRESDFLGVLVQEPELVVHDS